MRWSTLREMWRLPETDFSEWLSRRAMDDPMLKAALSARQTFQDEGANAALIESAEWRQKSLGWNPSQT